MLTRDKAIQRNPLEKRAIKNARVGFFVLSSTGLSGQEVADTIIRALASIERIAIHEEQPFIARILKNGSVNLVREKVDSENEDKG